jgi:acyl-CoA synthetase (AMP-forming)/AMP-acid ligase II
MEVGMPFPDFEPTLPVFLETRTAAFGERPLILLDDERISYAEAAERSERLARGLLASGVVKGTRVGLLMPNGPDWVVAWLAAARIGAVVVPLNTFYKARELCWVLRHADVHSLLMVPDFLNNDYLERLESGAPGLVNCRDGAVLTSDLPCLRNVFVWGGCDRAWAKSDRDLDRAASDSPTVDAAFLAAAELCVTPADPMVIIYSSGSTADPKGALHTHGTVIRHAFNLNAFRDLTEDDRLFSPMPFFWVGGFTFTLVSAMHAGAFMLCERVFEPGETLELLERERATIVAGWPHYSRAMVDHPSFHERDLSSIRSGNLYEILPEAVRPRDPELRSNALGMTETCGPHTIEWMNVDLPEKLRGAFGRSVPGLEHKIVDPRTGERLPTGSTGEICVRGYSLMQGLYKVEREEVFDGEGFYHTGDTGYFDEEGWLFFQGRAGDLIKTAGANVTPREVEVVIDAIDEVKAGYVVGVPDPDRGQNVAAAVILKQHTTLDGDTLRERLRGELSAYKVPRHIYFYSDGELPFTDSGKIDKRRLTALLSERIAAASD